MKSNTLIVILSLIIWASTSTAQDNDFTPVKDIDALKSKLTTHASNTNSISSNFVQEKHLWMLNEVLVSEGEFLFKKENSVKWKYTIPIDYTIIIHNGIFTIINNNKVNKFSIDSNPLFREINSMIVTAIRGDFIDNTDFDSDFFENDEYYMAELKPTNENVSSMLEKIEIYFDKQNIQVAKVVFHEPGDDFTLITFIDKKINSELSDNMFLIDTE
jgi:outer membrane lipoprotein carrier protein